MKSAVQKVQRMNKEAECTRQASRDERQRREGREESDPLEKSQQIIREAEAAKSHLFATKGNNDQFNITVEQNMNVTRSADVDERYLVIRAHVDPNIQQKIIHNEYVDFTKLLPKGRFSREDDNWLELVSRGGLCFSCQQTETQLPPLISVNGNKLSGSIATSILGHTLQNQQS